MVYPLLEKQTLVSNIPVGEVHVRDDIDRDYQEQAEEVN